MVALGLVRRVVVVVVVVVVVRRWRRIVVGQFMSSSRSSGSRGPLRLVVRQGRLVQAVVSMLSRRLMNVVVVVVLIGRVMVVLVLVLVWADAFGERVPPPVSLLLGELVLEDVPLLLEHVQLALESQHALVGAGRRRGPLVLLGLVVVRLKVVHDGQARVVDGGRGLVVLTVGGCGGGGVVVVVEGGHGSRPLLPLHHRVVDVPQQLPDRRQSFTTVGRR